MSDEFDTMLRTALRDVADATRPDDDLADRLIGNSHAGRRQITPLRRARRGTKWALPLLAAAAVLAVATGVVVGQQALSSDRNPATHQSVTPTHSAPPQPTSTPSVSPTTSPTTSTTTSHTTAPPKPANANALPAGFHAADVAFRTASDVWALGDAKCPHSRALTCATLGHSIDGGRSWARSRLPAGLTSTDPKDGSCGTNGGVSGPCVDQVLFADARHGYLWSYQQFYATSNGGRTWQHDTGGAGVTTLVVDHGVALRIRTVALCSSGCNARVERAGVGSSDWSDVTPSGVQPEISGSYLAVRGDAVYLFATDLRSPGATTRWLRTTSDGGRTWATLTPPCRRTETTIALRAASDGTFAAVCDGARGHDVVLAPSGANVPGSRAALIVGGIDLDLDAVVANTTLVASDSTTMYGSIPTQPVYYSGDGGATWTRTTTLSSSITPRFLADGFGYAATDEGRELATTADGGRTWRQQSFS